MNKKVPPVLIHNQTVVRGKSIVAAILVLSVQVNTKPNNSARTWTEVLHLQNEIPRVSTDGGL